MRLSYTPIHLALIYAGLSSVAQASGLEDDFSLQDLLDLNVSSASGTSESYREAPAAMVIVTSDDIEKRGYSSLEEIVLDLPGFDTTVNNAPTGPFSYQRGYRTPFTQRTLMMLNGIVDNNLWTHAANFDKQIPLTAIERIEVLYGPAGAVYGPNAFLGIVNIITKDASHQTDGYNELQAKVELGSFNSQNLDIYAATRQGNFSYNFAARYYQSDEPNIDDYAPWGYSTAALLANRDIWGPVIYDTNLANQCQADGCPHQYGDKPFGQYSDPSKTYGLLADINYKNYKLGWINWRIAQGYGNYYPADRAQPGSDWHVQSDQKYLKHQLELNEDHQIRHLLAYRQSRVYGDWAEATPASDALSGEDVLSWISISTWNSDSDSWLFKQDHEYQVNEQLQLVGGIKYEAKTLTKAYDVCSYWAGSFCSSNLNDTGAGIALSTDDTINIQPAPFANMPKSNLAKTKDKGIYLQGIWSNEQFRINAGIRYDENNLYGQSTNPRASMVYYLSDKTTFKLLYGTAFQEPAPVQLWGGWSGRAANPNLKPEDAENLEFILMHQQQHWIHDISFYTARYQNVIKEAAENAGSRHTYGIEYRGKFHYDNLLTDVGEITGYLYYSYTQAKSSVIYDHQAGLWLGDGIENCQQINDQQLSQIDACKDFNDTLGDIAPHKINSGINIPITQDWQLNLRLNWVASKTLYQRNPLRAQGQKNNSYWLIDTSLKYQANPYTLTFKVRNLFDKNYYHSGGEAAASGNDFTIRSQGWHNSLVPQVGRQLSISLQYQF